MSRNKLFGLCYRRPDLTPQAFHDHYRHPHGTLGRLPTTLRRYVQSHRIDHPAAPIEHPTFEAVAELWVDSDRDVASFRSEPNVVRFLVEDEPKFLDVAAGHLLMTREEVVMSTPPFDHPASEADRLWSAATAPNSIKLLMFVTRHGNREWASDDDGSIALALGALRYARCHSLKSMHGIRMQYLGVHEFWWPTLSAFERGLADAPEAWRRLKDITGQSVVMLAHAERFF
jgi:uncharacterized protein (TIGR02118 family)